MSEQNGLVMLRARFVGEPTPELKQKGYYKNIDYDLWIKQDGIKLIVKRADEVHKGESKHEYDNFWFFTEDWTYRFKYIR